MPKMKTTITKEDVEKAQEEIRSKGVCQSCVLHQAIKRETGKHFTVWLCDVSPNGSSRSAIPIFGTAARITQADESDWPSFIGTEIEIPEI